jgi:hypothetical protein
VLVQFVACAASKATTSSVIENTCGLFGDHHLPPIDPACGRPKNSRQSRKAKIAEIDRPATRYMDQALRAANTAE